MLSIRSIMVYDFLDTAEHRELTDPATKYSGIFSNCSQMDNLFSSRHLLAHPSATDAFTFEDIFRLSQLVPDPDALELPDLVEAKLEKLSTFQECVDAVLLSKWLSETLIAHGDRYETPGKDRYVLYSQSKRGKKKALKALVEFESELKDYLGEQINSASMLTGNRDQNYYRSTAGVDLPAGSLVVLPRKNSVVNKLKLLTPDTEILAAYLSSKNLITEGAHLMAFKAEDLLTDHLDYPSKQIQVLDSEGRPEETLVSITSLFDIMVSNSKSDSVFNEFDNSGWAESKVLSDATKAFKALN